MWIIKNIWWENINLNLSWARGKATTARGCFCGGNWNEGAGGKVNALDDVYAMMEQQSSHRSIVIARHSTHPESPVCWFSSASRRCSSTNHSVSHHQHLWQIKKLRKTSQQMRLRWLQFYTYTQVLFTNSIQRTHQFFKTKKKRKNQCKILNQRVYVIFPLTLQFPFSFWFAQHWKFDH